MALSSTRGEWGPAARLPDAGRQFQEAWRDRGGQRGAPQSGPGGAVSGQEAPWGKLYTTGACRGTEDGGMDKRIGQREAEPPWTHSKGFLSGARGPGRPCGWCGGTWTALHPPAAGCRRPWGTGSAARSWTRRLLSPGTCSEGSHPNLVAGGVWVLLPQFIRPPLLIPGSLFSVCWNVLGAELSPNPDMISTQ